MSLVLILMLATGPANAPAPAGPDEVQLKEVRALEAAVLAERSRIRSGVVEVDSTVVFHRADSTSETKRKRFVVSFDGDRIRRDRIAEGATSKAPGDEIICRVDGVIRFHSPAPITGGGELITKQVRQDGDVTAHYPTPDPRMVGLNADTFLNLVHYRMDSLIGGRLDRREVTAEPGERGGIPCRVLVYRGDSGVTRAWIAPDRGHNVLAVREEYGDRRVELACELAEVPGYGWFPSRAVLQEFDGNNLRKEETLLLKVRQFNEPVDDSTFTFAGMGVPAGRKVYDMTGETARTLVMTAAGPAERPRPDIRAEPIDTGRRPSYKVWLLVVNGFIFAGIALGVIWKSARKSLPQ